MVGEMQATSEKLRFGLAIACGAIAFMLSGFGSAAAAESARTGQALPVPGQAVPSQASRAMPSEIRIDVKPGDRWVYDVYDDLTGDKKGVRSDVVSEIRDGSITVVAELAPVMQWQPPKKGIAVYDLNWNAQMDPAWTSRPYDPSTGIMLPLKIGQTWQTKLTRTRQNPASSIQATATTTVKAWERVKLGPQSEYDAFRIETVTRMKAKDAPKSAEIRSTLWFSPEVNRHVRRDVETRIGGRLVGKESSRLSSYTRRAASN
jgi:hypothetical protein